MEKGGYDTNETGTFPGGDNDGYDDRTGLLDRERQEEDRRRWQEKHSSRRTESGGGEEVGMKERYEYPRIHYEPTTKTSTSKSGEQETSFIDTPSGAHIFLTREIAREELDKDMHEVFPNINKKLLPLIRRDDYGQLVLNLGKANSKDWVIAFSGEPSYDIKKAKFPKGVRENLGKTNVQINQENQEAYEKQQEEQAKREQEQEQARRREKEAEEKLYDANERLINLRNSLAEQERARNNVESPEEA